MENKITAVEWLFKEVELKCKNKLGPTFAELFAQAKEMEKEQIIDAWIADDNPIQRLKAEHYYNKTFKNK
jgi:hypothetical protein